MLSDFEKARIVVLRGLGYQQKEIAVKMGLTLGQVNYNLREINEDARGSSDASAYIKVISSGFGPELVRLVGLYERYAK